MAAPTLRRAVSVPRLEPGTVRPAVDALPDVLPTDRLNAKGIARRDLRDELRRIPAARNLITVLGAWIQVAATVAVPFVELPWLGRGHPAAWAAAFLAMGPAHARMAILMHESAHRLMFGNRRVNDFVGRWLSGYPGFVPFEVYRRVHFAHHRDEFGPDEPDMNFYEGYPLPAASFWRKMRRDATGVTGYKNLKPLLGALRYAAGRPLASRILLAQVVLMVVITAATGSLLAYPVLWLGSWMTVWKVMNRLRSIAEHGGMQRSDDRRLTTHHVRQQAWWARATVVPLNTGWHLAHHVDMGVPFRNLPRLHTELEAAGWVRDDTTWATYPQLWRALRSG